jgi:hypothetical protein
MSQHCLTQKRWWCDELSNKDFPHVFIVDSALNNVKNLRAVYCPVGGLPFTKNKLGD